MQLDTDLSKMIKVCKAPVCGCEIDVVENCPVSNNVRQVCAYVLMILCMFVSVRIYT